MLSLLMATFNGEKYIEQQLTSILHQSCQLDEVVIIDDKSNDLTVSIIKRFITDNKLLDTWHLYVNEQNCGWKNNFFYGVTKTKGDIIFFCDQDDIWHPDKVKMQSKLLKMNTWLNVIASKETLYYGEAYHFNEITDQLINVVLDKTCSKYMIQISGCTMAIRRTFYDKIKNYYTEGQAHDEFFWQFGQATDSIGVMSSPTILHRIHGNNESRKKSLKKDKIYSCDISIKSMNSLIQYIYDSKEIMNFEKKIKALSKRIHLVQQRLSLLEKKNFLVVPKLFIDKYHIYGRKRQLIKDILYALGFVHT